MVVSVTVVTEVLIVVVVDGVGAAVVIVVVVVVVTGAVVVGVTVMVDGAVGDSVIVSVLGAGAGATDCVVLGAAEDEDADGLEVVLVPAGDVEPEPTNFTTAYTSRARIAALSTPRPISAAGFWCHGVGGGGAVWP